MTTTAPFLRQLVQGATPKIGSTRPNFDAPLVTGEPAQHTWQTLVSQGDVISNQAVRADHVTYARFDEAQPATPAPWMLSQWSHDIGWHRSLAELQLPSRALAEAAPAPTPNESASSSVHLTQMLAEAAHDIRAPIAVASQILNALSSRLRSGVSLGSPEGDLIEQANLRLTQANNWAEGILLERRLEHGQPINVRRRFYPHQWRLGVEPLLESLAARRRVQLEWRGWDRSLPRLYLDPHHLSRIVLNLVTNALEASPPDSSLTLQVAWITNITQQLVLTIEDQGRGLPPHFLRKVNTLNRHSSEPYDLDSRGMGLTTAKSLTRGLGGSLRAEAMHTGGTRFTLSLPVDNYHALIRSWLQHNAELSSPEHRSARHRISIHAVRSLIGLPVGRKKEAECSLASRLDTRLQQAAGANELVYRVAKDRWLWLSLAPQANSKRSGISVLPSTLAEVLKSIEQRGQQQNEAHVCRQQQVFQLNNLSLVACLEVDPNQNRHPQDELLNTTSVLAEKIAELIGEHVPPIDELESQLAFGGTWSESKDGVRQFRKDAAQAVPAPVAAINPQAGSALADTPCETFSGALAEISRQWHACQQQLDRAHWQLGTNQRGGNQERMLEVHDQRPLSSY